MHIVICNERLLPRFGVDRLLLLLGDGLRRRGHHITFLCQRCDREAVSAVSSDIIELRELARQDLHGAEVAAARWLRENWDRVSRPAQPDVVVTGGWPFFRIVEVCEEKGVPSVFIDAGAVPHDGMSEDAVRVQQELRRVRAFCLPAFTVVLPISSFIRDSQTLRDRGTTAGVRTVLLGADHLEKPMFGAPAGGASDAASLAEVRRLVAEGYQLVLLLGRFEAEGYKNSPAAYDVMARILARVPNVKLLLLARSEDVRPPPALEHAILPLGFVSDATLATVISLCALGLGMSRWEGFNLPLAEMQWRGRPVLAFSLAAHPEVTVDPWLLCASLEEMSDKAVSLLQRPSSYIVTKDRFERFRRRFRWADVIGRYARIVEDLPSSPLLPAARHAASSRLTVLIDCTCSSVDPANPGVIRVVRRLGHVLQHDSGLFPIFVHWDQARGSYRILTLHEQATLATYDGPVDGMSSLFSPSGHGVWPIDNVIGLLEGNGPAVLFLPEVVLDGCLPERIAWARARDMAIAAVLYDVIPVTHSPFCSMEVVKRFPEYLEGLAAVDAVWAISAETLRQFERYTDRHSLPRPPRREAIWLPAQFGAQPRVIRPPEPARDGEPLVAVCVSSIEPRKNHRRLIEAFLALRQRRPDLHLELVLVGHRFEGAEGLAEWVASVASPRSGLTWTGLVQDAELATLFGKAAFTVYPSLVEGYGLPIVEGLWMGLPCLCHQEGVMAELATDGGCLTVDMADTVAIERGLERLTVDAELRQRLTREALSRKLEDWASYGAIIGSRLRALQGDTSRFDQSERNQLRSAPVIDTVLPKLRDRIRAEAEMLRDVPLRFVDAIKVPMDEAEARFG